MRLHFSAKQHWIEVTFQNMSYVCRKFAKNGSKISLAKQCFKSSPKSSIFQEFFASKTFDFYYYVKRLKISKQSKLVLFKNVQKYIKYALHLRYGVSIMKGKHSCSRQ